MSTSRNSALDPSAWSTRQQAILAAAERRFAQRGFHATKLTDIARDAKVTDGTIYLYFENGKDSLFDALLWRRKLELLHGALTEHSVREYGMRLFVGAEQLDRIARVASFT